MIINIYTLLLIRKKILIFCILLFSSQLNLFAADTDTIYTDNNKISLLFSEQQLSYIENGIIKRQYHLGEVNINNKDIKLMLDSCVWERYYEGKITQGHANILFFVLFNKKGKIDNICFSKPVRMSDDYFLNQVKSIIKDEIIIHQKLWKRSRKNKLSFYYYLYRINLYP